MPSAEYSNTLFMLILSLYSFTGSGMIPMSNDDNAASSFSPER